MMHKPKARKEYNDYLIQLISKYGFSRRIEPKREQLNDNKLILSLFAMVQLPLSVINNLPRLKQLRDEYNRLIELFFPENDGCTLNPMSDEDYEKYCRYCSIYWKNNYSKAYEFLEK